MSDAAGQMQWEDWYVDQSIADLLTRIGETPDDEQIPNYADWPITLPAGHWRAMAARLARAHPPKAAGVTGDVDAEARGLLASQYDTLAAEAETVGHPERAKRVRGWAASIRAGQRDIYAVQAIKSAIARQQHAPRIGRDAALRALKPFADRVFNDNGDMTVTTSSFEHDELVAAYFARKALDAAPTEPQASIRDAALVEAAAKGLIGPIEAAQDLVTAYDRAPNLIEYRHDLWDCLREALRSDSGRG